MNGRSVFGCSIKDFDVGEQLGKGGFATVYQARCRNTGRDVAIKKINKSQITAGGLINRVRQEVTIHSRLSHPSILQLYTFFEDQEYVYLVLEVCVKGELQKHLKNLGRVLTEDEAREYLRQIVDGMLYLHSKAIIHRDLTLSNILLDGQQQVKIADFGLATQLQRPDDRHTTMCGTPNYISPEVVTRSSHGLESDVWSLGCMLFIMLVGHPPFDGKGLKESIFTKVVMGEYKVPSYVSAEARSLIADCLKKNPKERIKLDLVPSHPFMTSGGRTDASRVCDSGMYTMTTVATTHHTRAPLAAISESEWSEGVVQPSGHHPGNTHSEPHLRYPPSPPVRMKSSPRDLLPPNAGVIDSLKRKFTPLPSLRRGEDFAFPPSSHPPPLRRERDVYEERHQQHHHHHQPSDTRHYSSSFDDKSSYNSSSSAPNMARDKCIDHRGARRGYDRSRKKSRSLERDILPRDMSSVSGGYYSDAVQEGHCQSNHASMESSCEKCSTQQSQSSKHIYDPLYSDSCYGGAARGSRDLVQAVDGYWREDSEYRHNIMSRENTSYVSRSHDYSHERQNDTAKERHGNSRRSRSLEKVRERPRDICGGRVREPEHPNARDRSREMYRDKTHPCSQSSHHRSISDYREQQTSASVCSSRHSRADNRDREGNSGCSHVSSNSHPKVTKPQSKTQGCGSLSESHSKMLSDIPSKAASSEPRSSSSTQGPSNPQHPSTPKKSPSSNSQTLRQQVSPLTSRRLRKVRYRSNRYFLNILENGEVCLEHLSVRHNQELVDDVCRISPDGLRIVIYRPNGGLGAAPGESPVPLPEEGADLIYSYENLPSKYWTKYKAAARFVKLLRSRTTKITYYSDQAKFYLMENSPNPDFVGHFYHGTKITQSNNSVVVREASGVSHTRQLSAASQAFPVHLHPLLKHFKEVLSHCLSIEQVLDDLAHKTELICFPAIMGSKPPAASSPPASTRSRGHPTYDKENLSPSSLQSFRSPHNIMAQLGSFEGSLASVHVGGVGGGVPPVIRLPLNPHSSNAHPQLSEQLKTSSVRVYVQNIGWASKGSSGEVLVEYLDGSRVQVSSNSPRVVFTEASGASTTYSVKDNLPLVLKEKLAQMETVLDCLAQSTVPKASNVDHR